MPAAASNVTSQLGSFNENCCNTAIVIANATANSTINGVYVYQEIKGAEYPTYKMLTSPYYNLSIVELTRSIWGYAIQDHNTILAYPDLMGIGDLDNCVECYNQKPWFFPQDQTDNVLGVSCQHCCNTPIVISNAPASLSINGEYYYQGKHSNGYPVYNSVNNYQNTTLSVITVAEDVMGYAIQVGDDIIAYPQDQALKCVEQYDGMNWYFKANDSEVVLGVSCASQSPVLEDYCCPTMTVTGGSDNTLNGVYKLDHALESSPQPPCRDGCVYLKDGDQYCFSEEDTGYNLECDGVTAQTDEKVQATEDDHA